MKLEPKHLELYLLHELKVYDTYCNGVRVLTGIILNDSEPIKIAFKQNRPNSSRKISEVKPILKPLSYLTKEEYNFIWNKEVEIECIEDFINLDPESRFTCKYSYLFWQYLFENHFDIFNLIEQGLAIDINTI